MVELGVRKTAGPSDPVHTRREDEHEERKATQQAMMVKSLCGPG